jgi:hypothetical protein
MKYIRPIFLLAVLVSCDNAYDAEGLAERYCDCMRNNKATEDFNKAANVCVDEFIDKNRYYKLWNVDFRDRELNKGIPNETRDSVKSFMFKFIDYTDANCCKEVLSCPDSTELK